eukprot:5302667-Lingulodinium_polyedra.AAC.1
MACGRLKVPGEAFYESQKSPGAKKRKAGEEMPAEGVLNPNFFMVSTLGMFACQLWRAKELGKDQCAHARR